MSAAPKLLLSPREYLARERLADFRSEFYRGEMFAIGTNDNLVYALTVAAFDLLAIDDEKLAGRLKTRQHRRKSIARRRHDELGDAVGLDLRLSVDRQPHGSALANDRE